MICENCGAHTDDANVRKTVCGGPVLCTKCDWEHWDKCAACRTADHVAEVKINEW